MALGQEIARLQVSIGADIKRLEKGISKAQRKIQDAGRSMQRVGRSLTMAITAPLAGVGGMALKTAADFESLQQSMNTLNGSVEEGTRNFERLQEFSATTPFQLRELAEAQNMLQGFGQSADDAFNSVQMIGDIAAVASGDIKGIGIAFGQAAAEGRLMTRDIRQLINQGVPAIKLLANTMGVAQSEVLDLASEGEISFEILQKAFREATTEGGMFANGMAKQAETLAGRFSTMKDNISLALGAVGDTMSDLAKGVMNHVINISKAFRELSDSTKQMITTAGLLAAAIPPVIFIMGKLITVIGALISPVGLAVAAIGGLVVIGKNLYDNWETITAELTHLWEGIELVAWEIVGGITGAFESMAGGVLNTLSSMAGVMQPSLVAPIEAARMRIQNANESIQDHIKDSRKEFEEAGKAAVASRDDMTSLSESFWSVTDAIQGGLTSGLEFLSDKLFQVSQQAKELNFDVSIDQARFPDPLQNADSGKLQRATGAMQRFGSVTEAALGMTFQKMRQMQALGSVLTDIANKFTDSFGQGMANVVVQGQKLVKVLENIGRLLASAVIQKAISIFLTGGVKGASGFFGKGGGLFGAIGLAEGGLAFGPTLAVVGDNKGARSNPEVIAPLDKLQGMMSSGGTTKVEGVIRGSDIHLANARGKNKFR